MAKKICGECGVERGKPHASDCSNSGQREKPNGYASPGRAAQGVLVSKTPMTRDDMREGLAVSRASGRIVHHTPTDLKMCACGSGELFVDCHGFVPGGE